MSTQASEASPLTGNNNMNRSTHDDSNSSYKASARKPAADHASDDMSSSSVFSSGDCYGDVGVGVVEGGGVGMVGGGVVGGGGDELFESTSGRALMMGLAKVCDAVNLIAPGMILPLPPPILSPLSQYSCPLTCVHYISTCSIFLLLS